MAESHDFKIIDDIVKRKYVLTKIGELELQIFDLELHALPENHPDYGEWDYQHKVLAQELNNLYTKYEELGGNYDKQEIRSVINHSH